MMNTMDDWLVERFEEHRTHLRAVGYRMLGSLSDADDALQETWLRLSRSDVSDVANLGGWLTTVMARVCLNQLRSRRTRRETPLATQLPDPIVDVGEIDPEHEALLADAVGLALLIVLDTLTPAERLAFVLHDMFAVPFEEIAPIVDRSPDATRQLASRARRRVQAAPTVDTDVGRQRAVVDAFLAASRDGDFDALLAVLDPDVVLRADTGAGITPLVGASAVAAQALTYRRFSTERHLVLVNGTLGVLTAPAGRPMAIMAFTIADDRIVQIDILADPDRIAQLGLAVPTDGG